MKKQYISPSLQSYNLNAILMQSLSISGTSDDEARSNNYKYGTFLWDDTEEEDGDEQSTLF